MVRWHTGAKQRDGIAISAWLCYRVNTMIISMQDRVQHWRGKVLRLRQGAALSCIDRFYGQVVELGWHAYWLSIGELC